jgi:DNA-binding NtrC family response regulator
MNVIRLLLVDDEERFLSTTRTILEKRGMDVGTALSGTEALKLLDERPFDVMVLDVKMPGMDGIEVLRKVKQRHPLVEVIMLTGHASVDSAVEGLRLGAFDYVMKPCNIPDLKLKIEEARAKKQAAEAKAGKARNNNVTSRPRAALGKDKPE